MEKIITKSRFRAKIATYSHAFDEFNNQIKLDDAINLSDRQYYLYPDKQVKLQNNFNGGKVGAYWVKPKNSIFIDSKGEKHNLSKYNTNESWEHNYFKGNIIEKGFFYYKEYKVLIKNAKPEVKIIDAYYRSDVSGQLLDGTPCIVEVIKTSDISEKKLNHIEENQILTFKIYIDEYGNQIPESDNIVGNREIEQIKESIQNGEGKIAEIRSRGVEAKKEHQERVDRFREEIEQQKRILIDEVERIERECRQISFGEGGETQAAEQRYNEARSENERKQNKVNILESEIERVESEIRSIERAKQRPDSEIEFVNEQIQRMEAECKRMEKTFIEIAERCEVEWFRNKWINSPVNNKIQELKYWTS